MKTLASMLVLVAMTVPMGVACTHEEARYEKTKRNWDGTVTHDKTTVRENVITGEKEIEKNKARY
jgi:hypothetical protein